MVVRCSVRRRRAALGLSQGALAERVGVSRQALSAIEAGRQIPSTALALQIARALACSVDDLFQLAGGAELHVRTAGSLARGERVVVGRVGEGLVAHRLADPSRAADAVVLEGGEGGARVELLTDRRALEGRMLVAGCAPLLGVLADRVAHGESSAAWIGASSGEALSLLERGLVHAAGIHWSDDVDAHVLAAREALRGQRVTLVHLARWTQGLVVAPSNPLGIRVGPELARSELRVVRRAEGAAAQRLLEGLCPDMGTAGPVAADHREVARLVRWGVADVGVAIEGAAVAEALSFLPITEERFDLVVPTDRLELPSLGRFIDTLAQPVFRAEANGLPGYDLSSSGELTSVEA